MTNPQATIATLEASGSVTPSDMTNAPERTKDVAQERLKIPSSIASAIDKVAASGIYDRELIEECFACLISGHLLLAGPPGTGKTQLARELAAAFGASMVEETANPEWSVYDVVGAPTLPGSTPEYRDGLLTRAVISCANQIVANLDSGDGPQATWLLIDEINRAEIDRAFGPLFTALSAPDSSVFSLDYRTNTPSVWIPSRFRIIATMNSFDTRFVNTMSAALRRRFGRVVLLPPPNDSDGSSSEELQVALARADSLVTSRLQLQTGSLRAKVDPHALTIREVVGSVRSLDEHGGIPVGTAQLIDTCVLLLTLVALENAEISAAKFDDLFDRALSSRLISSLESDAARLRLRPSFPQAFAQRFSKLQRANRRLAGFLSGSD